MTDPHRPEPIRPIPPSLGGSVLRTGLRLLAVLAFAYGVQLILGWVMEWTEAMPPGTGTLLRIAIFGGVLLAYTGLIAIPFVPGIEIGISLMLMRGAEVAALVYLATVAGLALAYLAGRLLPLPWLRNIFLDLRLVRACRLLDRIGPLSPQRRLQALQGLLPGRFATLAVRYRYLFLAGLINLPGSALIGGGGGICLVAGLTGLFRPRATLVTIALAVLPFPLMVWFWGPGLLS